MNITQTSTSHEALQEEGGRNVNNDNNGLNTVCHHFQICANGPSLRIAKCVLAIVIIGSGGGGGGGGASQRLMSS